MARTYRLFAYGKFLAEEEDHAFLIEHGAKLIGPAQTAIGYQLVEAGPLPGIVKRGTGAVVGELYEVTSQLLGHCDLKRDHPRLYVRDEIELEDGTNAWSYTFRNRQALGVHRIANGDYRNRFAPTEKPEPGAWVKWAKSRHRR